MTQQQPMSRDEQAGDQVVSRRGVMAALGGLGALGMLSSVGLAGQPGKDAGNGAGAPGAAAGGAGGAGGGEAMIGWDAAKGEFVLPALPYPADALEPAIDKQTMEIHHGKHHKAYVDNANKALRELAKIRDGGDAALIKFYSRELNFNASGHTNHTLFWHSMAAPGKGGGGEPAGKLGEAIARDFGSFAKFADHFKKAAAQVEGSGWGWLLLHPGYKKLFITQGEKQQDMTIYGAVPILGVDVWEHAYYLKYQNKRADYVDAFMTVVNWGAVGQRFERLSS
jgi:Fe-Mn family superoxide dismutase